MEFSREGGRGMDEEGGDGRDAGALGSLLRALRLWEEETWEVID